MYMAANGDEERPDAGKTPLNWISWAYQCECPFQLQHVGKMFQESRTVSKFLGDFYVMDVIRNRCPYRDGIEVWDNDGAPTSSLEEGGGGLCQVGPIVQA